MIYALSTGSRIIDVQAQEAALAMWKYCEDSARYLLDDTLTSPKAKRLLAVLRARPEGMTRREINDLVFKRNVPSRVITEVLESLKGLGVLICHPEATGGRAAERWVIRNNRIPGATNQTKKGEEQLWDLLGGTKKRKYEVRTKGNGGGRRGLNSYFLRCLMRIADQLWKQVAGFIRIIRTPWLLKASIRAPGGARIGHA